jgi:hypothetical protein
MTASQRGRGSRGSRDGTRVGSRGGSRGGSHVDALQAMIDEQDNAEVTRRNSHVLGLVSGAGSSKDFFDDDYEEEGDEDELYLESQASIQSEPSKASKRPSRVNARTKTAHLKNPVQACELMMKNVELFQRSLELKQNNQFQLVNENFTSFKDSASTLFERLFKSQQTLLKTIQNIQNMFSCILS